MNKKFLLVICYVFGEAPTEPGIAITIDNTPNIDALHKKYPFHNLEWFGEAVGLTAGSMGGSEVGHFTMGAGRIIPQFLLAVNGAIEDGSFQKNEALKNAFTYVKEEKKPLHLLGMISDKGVHSHIDHLLTLLDWAAKEKLEDVYIHCITDGRDVKERSAERFIKQIEDKIKETGVGKIAPIIGRYLSREKDKN